MGLVVPIFAKRLVPHMATVFIPATDDNGPVDLGLQNLTGFIPGTLKRFSPQMRINQVGSCDPQERDQ